MTENSAVCNNPSIETVKRLLLEDLHQSFVFDTNQQESTFCEVEDVVPRVSVYFPINQNTSYRMSLSIFHVFFYYYFFVCHED